MASAAGSPSIVRLLKLQLHGFKTFADRTEIEFSEGLTAVVGPNGCGKSNIADAILWVLGEQNPRLLRGSESRDVIFAGTEKRKPLGMAEVRLTIDNTDRALPIGFDEICVARKVYRSGESQYSLNGSTCRLKDIVELFLDTGLGRGAYSFVSQNDVDAVLSARPEERRLLFEEAAGINKYRIKKKEALRKLEQAEAHLTRVRDILRELEEQRAPLAHQAEAAERYLGLVERLRQIEVDLLVAELKRADYELYAARREQELDQQAIREHDARLAEMERDAERVGRQLALAEQELDTARLTQQSALTALERTESRKTLLEERHRLGERSAETLDDELRGLARRIAELSQEVCSLEESGASLAQQARDCHELLRLREAEENRLEEALKEARGLASANQEAARRGAEERARLEAALEAIRQRLAELEEADAARSERLRVLGEEQSRVAASLQAAAQTLAERRASLDALRDEEARTSETVRAEAAALDTLRAGYQELIRQHAEVESRRRALQEVHQSGEGYYQGVRAILSAVRSGKLAGSYKPLVDLLTVPEPYRVAIEVALGSSAQDIVCAHDEEAKAAIEWLKAHRAGRATFLPLQNLRPSAPLDSHAAGSVQGLVGRAIDLVTFDAPFAPAVHLALGRTLVAESMEAALKAYREVRGWSRIVTLEGEVLAPSGSLTGGSLGGRGAHLVGRKGEIDDLTERARDLREKCAQAEVRAAEQEEQVGRLRAQLEASARAILSAQAEEQAAASMVRTCEQTLQHLRQELDEQGRLATDAGARLGALRAEEAETQAELLRLREALQSTEADDGHHGDAVEQLTLSLENARAQRIEARIAVERLGEQTRALQSRRAAVQQELDAARTAQAGKQTARDRIAVEIGETQAELGRLAEQLREAREYAEGCQESVERWRTTRQELLQQSFDLSEGVKEISRRRAELNEELHAAELTMARLEVRLAQLGERLAADYSLSVEEALAREDPGDIDRDTVNEVARLRREIRQMGTVNTGAVEEYARITQRIQFLAEQEADLCSARESLLQTIQEIDQSTRGVFMETFNAVRQEFDRLYQRLFGGGSTQLILTNPDDLLETGIDVVAQPPGKRPQHLSLLSGGERALTAAALLMSFMVVRPSPFVLLDEIDAPLDGPNVEKFVELLREFGASTQIVVITHNPTTMEAAPRWYGVTMQEPGVSSILVYRVPPSAAKHEEGVEVSRSASTSGNGR